MNLITFTHQIAMSLHRVGLAGAAVNMRRFHRLGREWQQGAARTKDLLTRKALRLGMKEFQPTNDNHIRELLYHRLKYPVLEHTKKDNRPSVSKPTLKRLLSEHKDSAVVRDLMKFNAEDKLASTWYGKDDGGSKRKSIAQLIVPTPRCRNPQLRKGIGLLHFWIFPLRARTGRRASGGGEEGDPESRNSQNWPPPARKVIVSRWRKGKVAICDFTRLEVVVMGWRAKDEKLLHYFLKGNGYVGVAKEFWGQDVKEETALYKATKIIVLGLNYNMGPGLLAHNLWYLAGFKFSEDWEEHCRKTKEARRKYLAMFSGLRSYIRNRIQEATKTQRVISPSGRIRHLPHHGSDSEGFWHIRNAAVNFPIQSFASDITGSALVDYEAAMLQEHGLSYADWHRALLEHPWDLPGSPPTNEVHDEISLDLHPKTGKRDLELLLDCMSNVRTLKRLVPSFDLKLKIDVQVVDSWGDAK